MEKVLNLLSVMTDNEIYISNMRLTTLPDSPLWKNVEILYCDYNQLTLLPELPNVKHLSCYNNQLTMLPKLPNVKHLYCRDNQLTTLPELPNVTILYCNNNRLVSLPELPNVKELYCRDNQLTFLPKLPNVKFLRCQNNPFIISVKYQKYIHPILKITTLSICITRWKKYNQHSVSVKKYDLHNELLYSPDLPFVYRTLQARHWMENIIYANFLLKRNKFLFI